MDGETAAVEEGLTMAVSPVATPTNILPVARTGDEGTVSAPPPPRRQRLLQTGVSPRSPSQAPFLLSRRVQPSTIPLLCTDHIVVYSQRRRNEERAMFFVVRWLLFVVWYLVFVVVVVLCSWQIVVGTYL